MDILLTPFTTTFFFVGLIKRLVSEVWQELRQHNGPAKRIGNLNFQKKKNDSKRQKATKLPLKTSKIDFDFEKRTNTISLLDYWFLH